MKKWINVKNSLPKPPCLVFWEDGEQSIFDQDECLKYGLYMHDCEGKKVYVTHWRPLPNPPQGDD